MIWLTRSRNKTRQYMIAVAFATSVIWISTGITGCGDSSSTQTNNYLVKIDGMTLTPLDYTRALEIAKTAYPHNTVQNPDVLKSVKLRLLNQLIEEMIIAVKASEIGISVTDEEMKNAVSAIREDYPADEFKQAFLENAISFEEWKKRLKARLLIEKVLEMELQEKISITPDDIAGYYQTKQKGDNVEAQWDNDLQDIDQSIITDMRRKKAEDLYRDWIENLQKEYAVDINKKIWNKIVED